MQLDLEAGTLALAGELDIEGADALKEALLQLLGSPAASVTVDLAGVTEVDVATLQVFCAGVVSAGKRGKALLFRHASARVGEKLKQTGLHIPGMN